MGKNTSVSLGNHFDEFIAQRVAEGRFGSASEVIRAALRILEEEETKYAAIRAALEAGEKSGFAEHDSLNGIMQHIDKEQVRVL